MSILEQKTLQIKQLAEDILAAIPREADVVLDTRPDTIAGLVDPTAFYDYIRGDAGELFPSMSESQFKGVQLLLNTGAAVLPLSWMAYVLATAYHETAKTMAPVREGLKVSDDWRRRHLRYYPWYGRGFVQLTWERNYKLASKVLGVDLTSDPDKAMEPAISASIIVRGMVEGWFTGKRLRDYLPSPANREQFRHARKIINGTDRDDLVAGYAVEFQTALQKGEWR